MSRSTPSDWEVVASRMVKVPAALDGFIQTLRAASAQGNVAARRQALACAQQAEAWSGPSPFFNDYVARAPEDLQPGLGQAATAATAGYARLARYLRDEYAPMASEVDGVGADRYRIAAQTWLGMTIDPIETYRWGWDELHRVDREMAAVADEIRVKHRRNG
jgi:uncharacterized protein (DUF885 family)